MIGWPLLFYNYNLITTLVGVLFNGLSIGAVLFSTRAYCTEYVETNRINLRDNLLLWLGIAIFGGMALVLGLGFFLNYIQISGIATILALILSLLIGCLIPESPKWLRMRGKDGDAEIIEQKFCIRQPILEDEDGTRTTLEARSASAFEDNIQKIVQEYATSPLQLLIMLLLLLILSFCMSAFTFLIKDIDERTDRIVGMLFNGTSNVSNSSSTDNNLGSSVTQILTDVFALGLMVIVMGVLGSILKNKKKE